MFKIKMAGFVIEIDNKYSYIKKLCAKYIYEGEEKDFSASCTEEDISNEEIVAQDDKEVADLLSKMDVESRRGYLESVCVYRAICLQLPERNSFVMHAATIEVDGLAYAFTARSGTGKSTHISLWKKLLGDRVKVVNGDKPIIRLVDGAFYAYGTPWCGKEGWNRNVSVKLNGLCFIERAVENKIDKMPLDEAATRIMKQILIPKDALGAINTFELVDKMLNNVNCWLLGCNISLEAAEIAYKAMSGGKDED
ncbi:MAG: hypothetical protein E7596_05170 [Ruminococcaceae bacterium]|nr:hypothetical protein [Oscillospiraceae bacterium]